MSFSIHIVCELRFCIREKASERLFRALADIEIICVGIDIALEQERALLRIVYSFNEFVVPFGVVDRLDELVLCAYAALFELLRRLKDSRALGKDDSIKNNEQIQLSSSRNIGAPARKAKNANAKKGEFFVDKPKKQKKKIIEIPQYNDPMNKEGVIPTDVLGSYSGTPLDGSQPVQDVDDL